MKPSFCPYCGEKIDPSDRGYTPTSSTQLVFTTFKCDPCARDGMVICGDR